MYKVSNFNTCRFVARWSEKRVGWTVCQNIILESYSSQINILKIPVKCIQLNIKFKSWNRSHLFNYNNVLNVTLYIRKVYFLRKTSICESICYRNQLDTFSTDQREITQI